jgi:hypothetical protein
MKQVVLLIAGLFFITSVAYAQRKSFFKPDSTFNNLTIFKTKKPIQKSVFENPSTLADNSHIRLKNDFFEVTPKSYQRHLALEKERPLDNMPVVVPEGNYALRVLPADSTQQYSLLIVKPN